MHELFDDTVRDKQMVESRFEELIAHSALLLKKKWLFGILDDFTTKQLPHNVTWGLSLLYAIEHKGDRALTSTQGEFFFPLVIIKFLSFLTLFAYECVYV